MGKVKMKVVGYCPHAHEDEAEADLRETGWLFGRVGDRRLLTRVCFGSVREIYSGNFNTRVMLADLHIGMSLDHLSNATRREFEVADFVTSSNEVAQMFLSEGVEAAEASMRSDWTPHQLARLLTASRLCGEFEPPPPMKVRPIL